MSINMNEINANIRNLERRIKDRVKRAVEDSCLDLQRRAIERAPKDTGDLRGSSPPPTIEETSGKIVGEVGFGVEYALRQHEELSFRHTDGEAKYLENPMKENEERYKNSIKNAVRDGVID